MKALRHAASSLLALGILLGGGAPRPAFAEEKAAPKPVPKTVIVFLTAFDDSTAENSLGKLQTLSEEAVSRSDRYELTSLREMGGEVVSAEARSAKKAGDDDLAAGKKAFLEGQHDIAFEKLKGALKSYDAASSALDKIDPVVDAYGYLGAVYQLRNKTDDARDMIQQALALKSGFKPDPKFGQAYLDLLRDVRREVSEGHKGSIAISTVPSGAKVFVDGEFRGYAPNAIERLPLGKHHLRLEKPGYLNLGQTVEVNSVEETTVKSHFQATREFADFEDAVPAAVKECDGPTAGPSTWKLVNHFKVDRAVFGTVKTSGDSLVLELALVDNKAHRRIARVRRSLEGEESGALNRSVNKVVEALLTQADEGVQREGKRGDPLNHVSGMEDWDEDGAGAAGDDAKKGKKKKASNDD